MLLEARLADVRALRAASTMEYCDSLLSPGIMPDFQDISNPTFTWTGGEDIPDCYKSSVQVQPSVESSSEVRMHRRVTTR